MRAKNLLTVMAAVGLVAALASTPVLAQGTMFVTGDQVGVGTATPDEKFHVKDGNHKVEQTGAGVPAKIIFTTASASWDIFQNGNTGRLIFRATGLNNGAMKFDTQAQTNLLLVGTNAVNQVDITGNLVVSGTITPDYVFEPDFALESIEDHAKYMWTNKHLPAVGAAVVDETGDHRVNVGHRAQGTLEELEKAHIYIEQLHNRLLDLEARLETMEHSSR